MYTYRKTHIQTSWSLDAWVFGNGITVVRDGYQGRLCLTKPLRATVVALFWGFGYPGYC